jgi:hypothetical protein
MRKPAISGNKLYLVYHPTLTGYTQEPGRSNTDIWVWTATPSSGVTWSGPIRVNNDSLSLKRSQFHPRVAVDANSGKVAVSWYDCRLSGSNSSAHFFAAVSKDSFATAPVNFQLNPSSSSGPDFRDYTGLYYYNGVVYPAWQDKSNHPGTNPDGTTKLDCYVAKIPY